MNRITLAFDRENSRGDAMKRWCAVAVFQGRSETFQGLSRRASVAFSYGSHDEWNIAHVLNERRRGANEFGIAGQISILFDGNSVTPSNFEGAVAAGDVGSCVN